jgi:hypothetical protein
MRRAIMAVLPFLGSALAAQQHPLVGTWQVTYSAGARIQNGVASQLTATGVLTVVTQGDSLIGTLVSDSSPDLPPRPPARLAGKAGPGPTTFMSRTTGIVNTNGNEREITAVSTWILEAKGDSLGGTVERRLEGMDLGRQPPQPVSGTRRNQ